MNWISTGAVVQRDGAGLHGDPSDLLVLSAVQIPQLEREGRTLNRTEQNLSWNIKTPHRTKQNRSQTRPLTFPASRFDMIPLLATRQSANVVLPENTDHRIRLKQLRNNYASADPGH